MTALENIDKKFERNDFMKTKRFLAWFLTLAMLWSLIPVSAVAETETGTNGNDFVLLEDEPTVISSDTKENTNQAGGIIYTKTSTAKSDGTIDITLTAHTTGVVRQLTSVTPTDIVLVLDVSGSMNDPSDSFSVYKEVFGSSYTYYEVFIRRTGYGFNNQNSYYINTGTEENPVYTRVSRTGRDNNRYDYFEYSSGNNRVYVYPELRSGTATNRSYNHPVYQFYSLEIEEADTSRIQVLKDAVYSFIDTTATMNEGLESDEMHTISIVKFADDSYYESSDPTITEGNHKGAGNTKDYNYSEVVKGLTPVNAAGATALKAAVNELDPGGATAVDYGLKLAETVLMNRSIVANESAVDRNEVVILFTDGEPNYSSGFEDYVANRAIATAGNMEKTVGVTVYGVCIAPNADATDLDENMNKFMHYVSSNYPGATSMGSDEEDCDISAGYYMTPDDSTTLTMIFESIIQDIDHPTITMGEEATMVDTISPYFDFQGTVNDVKLQTSARNSDGTWADPVDDQNLVANITNDRLTVDGFDFDANYVSETGRGAGGDFYGKRLVVSFTVVPDYDVIDIASATLMDGILPTNSGFAALVDSDSTPAAQVPTPELPTHQVTYMVDGAEYATYNRFTGSDVEVDAEPTKLGYTFSGWTIDGEEVDPGNIFKMPGEDVVIVGEFTPYPYNVTYQYSTTPPTGAPSLPTSTTAQYGDTVTVANQLELQGYVFVGWYPLQTDVTITEGTFTMPAKDVTLVGYFESSTTTPYKIEHYLETLNDGVYETTPEISETFYGTTNNDVTATPLNRFTGFTYNETASAATISDRIKADGTLVLKVYYDRNEYNVTYGYDGDTQIDGLPALPTSGTYKYGEQVSVADKAVPPAGYTFTGWYRGTSDNPVDGTFTMPPYSVNLLGYFTANTSTEYKVEHYLMDIDGTYPATPADTETFRGTTGNTVTAIPLVKYTGFTYDDEKSALTKSGSIAGDGSLVLELYYSRNKYTVTYVYEGTAPDGAPAVPAEKKYYYGETVTVASVPAVDGYNFEGWSASVSALQITNGEFEMPNSNVEFRGRFVPGPTTYTVEHYTETLNGDYEFYDSNEHNGITGTKATYTPLTITGFYFDDDNENNVVDEVIRGNGSTVIKLYYNRNRYTITYQYGGNQPDGAPSIPDSYNRSSVMYGETVTVEKPMEYEGYEFDGWYPSILGLVNNGVFEMPADNVLFRGRFIAHDDTEYTVEHYIQTLDGDDYELYETQSRYGTTDQPALYTPLTIDGFYFDRENENNVLDEPVAGDGSTVLELYYNRNLHNITYEYIGTPPEGAPELPTGKKNIMYGAEEEVEDILTLEGYTFEGWLASVLGLAINNGVFEMPDSDVKFRGRFVPGPTTYIVEHYLANEDNTGYESTPYTSQNFSVTTGETITATPIVIEGFTYDDIASSATKTAVIAGNGSTVLKLYYSRNPYNVTYKYEGDLSDVDEPALPADGTYTYGTTVTVANKVTAPAGYTFVGWYMGTNNNIVTSFDMPARDVELLGHFIPNSGVPYSVHHYLETLTDGVYETTPEVTESFSGTTGHTVTATPLNRFTGFKYNESASTISGEIEGDGSLVLKVYYDREQYTVTYGYEGDIPDGAPDLPAGGTYDYGAGVPVAAIATAPAGYTFVGWYRGTENNPVSETFTMPNFNVHILGNFKENTNTPYRVEHYLQTEDRTGYELDGVGETRHGTTDAAVSALPKEYPGFTYNSAISKTSGTIKGDGTLVLKFYYDRNLHDVTYVYEGIAPERAPDLDGENYNGNPANDNVPFGKEVVVAATPNVPGYTFVGWYIDGDTNIVTRFDMPDKDVVLKGKFSSNLVDYTVNYWLQNINDDDYTLDSSYTEKALVGQHIEAISKSYTGFSLNTSKSKTFDHVTVDEDGVGNLVLNLYYDRHTYNVTYGYYGEQPENAPDLSGYNKTNVRFGTELDVEEKPEIAGYAFDGWYTRTATVTDNEFTMPDHNVEFLGRFIAQYTVSYDLNDGTGASGVSYDDEIVTSGTVVDLKAAPTRTDYVFTGWSNTTNTYQPDDEYTVNADVTFTAQWEEDVIGVPDPDNGDDVPDIYQKKITFKIENGKWADGTSTDIVKVVDLKDEHDNYSSSGTANITGIIPTGMTANSGYRSGAWDTTPPETVSGTDEATYTYSYKRSGGGGGVTIRYTLTYETNGGNEIAKETYNSGVTVKLTKVPVKDGYVFEGWHLDEALTEDVTEVKMTKNITVYAAWVEDNGNAGNGHETPGSLNGEDHFAYVVGYPDGTVRPNDNISRAEVTAIFFRLLKPDEVRDNNLTTENNFNDVNDGDWYNTAISTMAKLGIVNGRTEESFVPNAFITRAEFAAICARFDGSEFEVVDNFTDVAGHWAEDEIHEAAAHGWIRGYEDGTFKPDQFITRAEAMTMINRVLNRVPETVDDLLDNMIKWPDNSDETAWYYLPVQEATNSHDYDMKNHIYEKWTALREVTDWTKYE